MAKDKYGRTSTFVNAEKPSKEIKKQIAIGLEEKNKIAAKAAKAAAKEEKRAAKIIKQQQKYTGHYSDAKECLLCLENLRVFLREQKPDELKHFTKELKTIYKAFNIKPKKQQAQFAEAEKANA